jgi:predicted CoA-substrate-specific enzyme activase
MICAGIDAGSRALKIALIDAKTFKVVATGLEDQGVKQAELASDLFDKLLASKGLDRSKVGATIATGYGRDIVDIADTTVTEITCHARGVLHDTPEARTIIDIGGQDSKLIRLDPKGAVRDFAMNDRCAAGTGRFLEVIAERLKVGLKDLGEMAGRAKKPAAISSMCVVFAETEIVGLLASGIEPENIVAGAQTSIATRVTAMAGRKVVEPIVFTGGGAMVSGMDKALSKALGHPVTVADSPQMTGALGAAILAAERAR